MADFTDLADLASERLGGKVLWATVDTAHFQGNFPECRPAISLGPTPRREVFAQDSPGTFAIAKFRLHQIGLPTA